MPTSISALTGVQWTDLDGSNLSTAAEAEQLTLVQNITTEINDLTDGVNALSPTEAATFNQVIGTINSQIGGTIYTAGSLNYQSWPPPQSYCAYTSYAAAAAALARMGSPAVDTTIAVSYSSDGGATWDWALKNTTSGYVYTEPSYRNYAVTQMFANAPNSNRSRADFVLTGVRAPNQFCAYTDEAQARTAIAKLTGSSAVSFYNRTTNAIDWVVKNAAGTISLASSSGTVPGVQSMRETYTNVITSTTPLASSALTLAQVNAQTGLSLTENSKLTADQWRLVIHKLKEASYKGASKLTLVDGGGIKTYGGKWYVNGEEVSYMDVIFAVRVNQLFVISNNVTNFLTQVQKNNKLIKAANAISAIFSAMSPSSSTGTVTIFNSATNTLGAQLITTGVAHNLVGACRNGITEADALIAYLATNNSGVIFTGADGLLYLAARATVGGVTTHTKLADVPQATLALYNVVADYSKLTAMLPSSMTKVFANTTEWAPYAWFQTSTLSQTDCTTITTELKSYTSNLETDNQTAQTQLEQYNNKRSEVLDGSTNVVKGVNSALNSIAKNLGTLA